MSARLPDIESLSMETRENMHHAATTAEAQLLTLRELFSAPGPQGRKAPYYRAVPAIRNEHDTRFDAHYEKLGAALVDYIAVFGDDDRLVPAVVSAMSALRSFSTHAYVKKSINAMCSLLSKDLSPVMLIAAEQILREARQYVDPGAASTVLTAAKNLLVDAEKELGAENLSELHADIVVSMLRPRFAERFGISLLEDDTWA